MEWKLVFYADTDGNEPVKNFILAQPDGAIAEILHVFKLLRELNISLGMPYVRKIDKSGLRELRIRHSSSSYRIFFFTFIRQEFVLLHAIEKKTDKIPRKEKDCALERMNKYQLLN